MSDPDPLHDERCICTGACLVHLGACRAYRRPGYMTCRMCADPPTVDAGRTIDV